MQRDTPLSVCDYGFWRSLPTAAAAVSGGVVGTDVL